MEEQSCINDHLIATCRQTSVAYHRLARVKHTCHASRRATTRRRHTTTYEMHEKQRNKRERTVVGVERLCCTISTNMLSAAPLDISTKSGIPYLVYRLPSYSPALLFCNSAAFGVKLDTQASCIIEIPDTAVLVVVIHSSMYLAVPPSASLSCCCIIFFCTGAV